MLKKRKKAWHDRQIKSKQFEVGGLVLMHEKQFLKRTGKLRTHQLGPYIITKITDGGVVKLQKLDGTKFQGLVNGSRLKPYHDSSDLVA